MPDPSPSPASPPPAPPSGLPALGRRAFLAGVGAGAGLLLARGLGVAGLGTGERDEPTPDALIRALATSLTPHQRARIVLPGDDPSRQIANTISVLERPHLGTLLSPPQRELARRLYLSLLSPQGRDAFAGTVAVEGRLDGCVLALYGEPERGRAQAVLAGGHLMLRGGGEPGHEAFGGGVAYGHQIGNGEWRVPGNAFAPHGDAANRLFGALSADERARAILPEPPHELVLQVQSAGATFPGVAVGSLSDAAQEESARLLDVVLASYPDAERARARACIDANGGPGALHFAVYASHGFYSDMQAFGALDAAERAQRGDPYWQIWRLEGPGAVIHFKGHPHVHAYVRIVGDPARANIGETLAETRSLLEGEALRRLYEGALRRATGEALAFQIADVPGRFCPGEITTGLAYSLDPYRNHVVVAEIPGRAMAPALRERLAARHAIAIDPSRRYRVATIDYAAGAEDRFGTPDRVDRSPLLLRDALVAHLRAGGLADATG